MVSSTSNRSLSEMSGFNSAVESPLLNVPPPLPPRLRDPNRPNCLFEPSSSRTSHAQSAATKCIDEYRLFPCTLEVPHSDFDANSVGFVDIQELRELDDSDCASVGSLPLPVLPRPTKRKSFASLRKLFPRCHSTPRGYGSLEAAIKSSAQEHCLIIGLDRKRCSFANEAPSVLLPCPPPTKKRSFRKTIQKFVFCGLR
ncbi:hypothetical protein Aduo_009608 [Ancylostoma duodenale]